MQRYHWCTYLCGSRTVTRDRFKKDLIESSNLLSSDHAPIQSVQQCRCLAVSKCQMLVISPNLLIELKMVQLSSQIHFVHLFIFGLFHYQIMSFQLSHMYQRSKLQFAKLSIRHILNLRCLMQYAYWQKIWDHTTPLECIVSFFAAFIVFFGIFWQLFSRASLTWESWGTK